MGTKKIDSLEALRLRKRQINTKLKDEEQQIKYHFYLYSHPVEWAANALTGKNLPVTSRNLVKLVTVSSRFVKYSKVAFSIIKLIRGK
ncbi:MAG: hypothetical protein FWD66_09080 [Paludibacter sp.]|nr:hypothetical protein [Paludibacter sp.]